MASIACWSRRFQLTAARRRLAAAYHVRPPHQWFQLTAARRRLVQSAGFCACRYRFQLTAARRRLDRHKLHPLLALLFQLTAARRRLGSLDVQLGVCACFNSQPPEGGWRHQRERTNRVEIVSTHSRPKAAGRGELGRLQQYAVSTHSRPKAAGFAPFQNSKMPLFQLTAARRRLEWLWRCVCVRPSFNSQPPEGGWI